MAVLIYHSHYCLELTETSKTHRVRSKVENSHPRSCFWRSETFVKYAVLLTFMYSGQFIEKNNLILMTSFISLVLSLFWWLQLFPSVCLSALMSGKTYVWQCFIMSWWHSHWISAAFFPFLKMNFSSGYVALLSLKQMIGPIPVA